MLESVFDGLTLRHVVVASAILVFFIILALFLSWLLRRAAKKLVALTKTGVDDTVLSAIRKPFIALVIIGGVYLSALALPWGTGPGSLLIRALSIVLIVLGIYTVVALIDGVVRWYQRDVLGKRKDMYLASRLLNLFRITVFAAALLAAILIGLRIWGIGSLPVTTWIGEHGWRIALIIVLATLLIIGVGELVPRFVTRSLARRAGEPPEETGKRGDTLSRVLIGTGEIVVILIALFTILSELDIDIAPILAGVGVVGIAIGFGAQSLVKDILAGVFIIMENQYRVGDVVKVADVSGLVEDINLRRTVLRDLDGAVHFVPNGEIRVASNFTKEWSRVNLNISVAYSTDLERAMALINRVGKELAEDPAWSPKILSAPQALRVDKLGDSGIEIKILGDTRPIHQWDIMGELRKRLKKAFDEEGIEIPWPHTKVYFGNTPFPGKDGGDRSRRG